MKKVNLNRISKYFLYTLLVVVLLQSCNEYVEIEQKISTDSFCDQTKYVTTYVWINKYGFKQSIEKGYFRSDITESKLDSVMLVDLKKAKAVAKKIELCLVK